MSIENPTLQLRWSEDGGQTWGNWIEQSIGKMGEYNKLVQFQRLGQGRNRVFQLRCTDPVDINLMGAILDLEPGAY